MPPHTHKNKNWYLSKRPERWERVIWETGKWFVCIWRNLNQPNWLGTPGWWEENCLLVWRHSKNPFLWHMSRKVSFYKRVLISALEDNLFLSQELVPEKSVWSRFCRFPIITLSQLYLFLLLIKLSTFSQNNLLELILGEKS